jgi:hypothetical protein
MKKFLLIIAWEYEGYHSDQGVALSRRITQVAESFNTHGWEVAVIHCDHRKESGEAPFKITTEKNGIKRIAVKFTSKLLDTSRSAILRKLETLYYVAFKGDRTSKWAKDVIDNEGHFGLNRKPDYIISFYEPRVSILLGNYFSQKWGAPWIQDIQDPILEGISPSSRKLSARWVGKMLKPAKAIVHISPEWAEIDGKVIGRKIETIRHAIPQNDVAPDPTVDLLKDHRGSFNVFYGGSLSADIQSLSLLKQVMEAGRKEGVDVKVFLGGNKIVEKLFRDELGDEGLVYLGWLSRDMMNKYILSCDCTVVIPWSKARIGIPSKFYELCIYPKPIWIIGNDLGAFDTLLGEWKHPPILIGDFEYQKDALMRASRGDYSGMFVLGRCKGKPLRANDLYGEYVKLMQK